MMLGREISQLDLHFQLAIGWMGQVRYDGIRSAMMRMRWCFVTRFLSFMKKIAALAYLSSVDFYSLEPVLLAQCSQSALLSHTTDGVDSNRVWQQKWQLATDTNCPYFQHISRIFVCISATMWLRYQERSRVLFDLCNRYFLIKHANNFISA